MTWLTIFPLCYRDQEGFEARRFSGIRARGEDSHFSQCRDVSWRIAMAYAALHSTDVGRALNPLTIRIVGHNSSDEVCNASGHLF